MGWQQLSGLGDSGQWPPLSMPELPSKIARELQPPRGPAAHPSLGWSLCWKSRQQWWQGVRGSHASMLSSARAGRQAKGTNIPPGHTACLLEAYQRNSLRYSLLSLVPRTTGTLSSCPL